MRYSKRILMALAAALALQLFSGSAYAQVPGDAKVHLILTGYTKQDNVGIACQKDIDAMKNVFQQAFSRSELVVHELHGDAWSGTQVMNYLSTMVVGRNDVVVFYHSGHGGGMIHGKEKDSHMLSLNLGDVNRGQVRNLLQAKQPRGLIILTDCCSAYSDQSFGRALTWKTPNAKTVRNLFLNAPVLIDITAAEDGKLASSQHNASMAGTGAQSALTVALLWTMADEREYATWQDFFPKLVQNTEVASQHQHKPKAFFLQEAGASVPSFTQPVLPPVDSPREQLRPAA